MKGKVEDCWFIIIEKSKNKSLKELCCKYSHLNQFEKNILQKVVFFKKYSVMHSKES